MDAQNMFSWINTASFIRNRFVRTYEDTELYTQEFLTVVDALFEGHYSKAKRAFKKSPDFIDFKTKEEDYEKLPVKHIAVCATMSAGKSTFINALLGKNVLPARNEATTAKITSIFNKDDAKHIIGFVQTNTSDATDFCGNVTLKTMDAWNDRSDVSHIFLQGNLDGITNKTFIIAVHDTPGTNNSKDTSHYDTTMRFLQENQMDALIFIANATQLCTNDERILLSEVLKQILVPRNMRIIFVLNKSDLFDPEKEDIVQILNNYRSYLYEIGFANPLIFPVSAKAARFFKTAKNRLVEQLTAREEREFSSFFENFNKLHDFSTGTQSNIATSETIKIAEKEYPLAQIHTALERSGLPQVEHYIGNLFSKER